MSNHIVVGSYSHTLNSHNSLSTSHSESLCPGRCAHNDKIIIEFNTQMSLAVSLKCQHGRCHGLRTRYASCPRRDVREIQGSHIRGSCGCWTSFCSFAFLLLFLLCNTSEFDFSAVCGWWWKQLLRWFTQIIGPLFLCFLQERVDVVCTCVRALVFEFSL